MSSISSGTTLTTALVQTADTSGVLQLQTNGGTTAVTIDNTQNVGIGTSSPSYKLDVNGQSRIYAGITISPQINSLYAVDGSLSYYGSGNGVYLNGNSAGFLGLRGDGSGNASSAIQLYGATSGNPNTMTFSTNSTERMRIDSSGNLLVGLTSYSAQNVNYIALQTSGGNLVTAHASGTPSGYQYAAYLYNAGVIGSITQNGTTSVNFNGYIVNPSDQKLKTNIVDAPSSLLLIDKIQIRSFDWIAEEKNQSYGVIAQELETVFPEAVNAPTNEGGFYGVDYTKLIPMLVKAIQELNAKVTTLQTQVTALKG